MRDVGGDEGVVLARELLDQLLVLVQLLEIIGGHSVDAVMLGSVDIVLVTKDAGTFVSVCSLSGGLDAGRKRLTRQTCRDGGRWGA